MSSDITIKLPNPLTLLEAQNLHKRYRTAKAIVAHCDKVAKIALEMSTPLIFNVERAAFNQYLATASLLHDIGRSRSHDIDHGVIGGQILRHEGYPHHARVAEVHVLGGLSRFEAQSLGLPFRDYRPRSLVEKIVTYADKRVRGTHLVSVEEKWTPWFRKFGNNKVLKSGLSRTLSLEKELLNLGAKVP